MDIKDVNNASNPLLFNRATAQSSGAAALGAGFASLIGQGAGNLAADLLPSTIGKDKPDYRADNSRPNNAKRDDKNAAAEVSRPNEEKKTSKSEKKIQEKIRSVTEDIAEQAVAAPQSQITESSPVEEDGVSEIENVAGTDKSVTPVLLDGEPAVEFSDNLEISTADGMKLTDNTIKLSDLAKMDSVTFYNPETGESVTMSGAELAAKLAESAKLSASLQSLDNDGLVAAPAIDKEIIKSALDNKEQNIAVNSNNKTKITNAGADIEYKDGVSDEMQNQNAKLADMLDGKNLKVEVNVKEEKNSYLKGSGLIRDRLALDNAVAAADASLSDGAETANPLLVSANNNTLKTPANNAAMMSPIVNAATVVAADNDAAVLPSSQSVVEGASVNSTSTNVAASLSGSELTNAAKAEANAKAADTSFRDVYKGMSKEAVEQVKVNITKSAVKGVDTINVRLKPEDLGQIEIKMQIKDGKLQAHIISSRPETMEALQKEAQTLEKAFNDAGFQTDEGSLNFSFRDGSQANQNQERNSGLRNFIGDVFENEANTELTADVANQGWSLDSGLNIRV